MALLLTLFLSGSASAQPAISLTCSVCRSIPPLLGRLALRR